LWRFAASAAYTRRKRPLPTGGATQYKQQKHNTMLDALFDLMQAFMGMGTLAITLIVVIALFATLFGKDKDKGK
jgi:hypothetical protein